MKQHDRVDNSSVAPGGAPTDVHARSKLSDFGQIEESLKAAPTDATFALVYSSSAARMAATASSRRAVPLSSSPSLASALPAQIVLRHRPVEWNARAGQFLQRDAIRRDRLLQTRRPALPLPERLERSAEIVLCHRPSGTRSRVLSSSASR